MMTQPRNPTLEAAIIALMRADDATRGYNRDHFLSEASDHLEAAGLPDLAARAEQMMHHGGGDIGKLIAAVEAVKRNGRALSLCRTALRMIARGSTDQDARDTADAALMKAGELVKGDAR